MGEWKKILTGSDLLGAISNVSESNVAVNKVLKYNGSNWVAGDEGVSLTQDVNTAYFSATSNPTSNSNTIGSWSNVQTGNSYIDHDDEPTTYQEIRTGTFISDFYFGLDITNTSSADDYSGTSIKTATSGGDDVNLNGTFSEDNAETYNLTYAKAGANISYPSDGGDGFSSAENEILFKFLGDVTGNNAYSLNLNVKFTNTPRWGFHSAPSLASIGDGAAITSAFQAWSAGNEHSSYNKVNLTTMTANANSKFHFSSSSDGFYSFTAPATTKYFWFAVPARMNPDNGDTVPTYTPTVRYKEEGAASDSGASVAYMGEQSAIANNSSNGYSESMRFWRTTGSFDEANWASGLEFKITWTTT